MTLHPLVRPYGLFIGILGIVQAVVWSLLSLLVILVNRKIIKVDEDLTVSRTYLEFLNLGIYKTYLKSNPDSTDVPIKTSINSDVFLGCSIVYLILSLLWLSISCYFLWTLYYSKWNRIRICFLTWIINTSLISLLDLILSSFLAKDLHKAMIDTATGYILISPIGVVMTIVARGYILLLVNIIATILLSVLLWIIDNKILQPDTDFIYSQSISAFDENTTPPWYLDRPQSFEPGKPDIINEQPDMNNPWSTHQHPPDLNPVTSSYRKESTNNDPNGWFVEVANENNYAKPNNSFVNPMFANDIGTNAMSPVRKSSKPYKDTGKTNQDEEKYASIGRRGRKPLTLSIIPPPNVPPSIPAPDYERNTPPVNPRYPNDRRAPPANPYERSTSLNNPRNPPLRPVLRSNNIY